MTPALKRGDRALIALIAVCACAGAAWLALRPSPQPSRHDAVVVCQSKDGFYRADPLDTDCSYTVETPGTGTGDDAERGENRVVIHDGAVTVESANCGNQVCVQHDPIDAVGEQIVCLPHGVVIEIANSPEEASRLS